MFDALRLIPSLQIIFKTGIEFTVDSFVELNEAQRDAYRRKMDESDEEIFRVVAFEPTVVDRQDEKVTLELSIVTASERQLMLHAVGFIYAASAEIPHNQPTFQQRLEYLRSRFPPFVIGEQ